MNTQARTRKSSARLGAYLATGISASTVAISSSDAAIVQIDIGSTGFNMDGINAGLSSESMANFFQFPASGGGQVTIWNFGSNMGIFGVSGLGFAYTGYSVSPRNFAYNSPIGSSASFTSSATATLFRRTYYGTPFNSPDFGPGSYMGFKTAQGNYGWLEVTWDSKASQFEILSGAYESTPSTSILAGATTSVPEPSSSLLALVAGGAAFARRRRQRAA